jgi:hypothetical protein
MCHHVQCASKNPEALPENRILTVHTERSILTKSFQDPVVLTLLNEDKAIKDVPKL